MTTEVSARPVALAVRVDGIPEELRRLDRWIAWRYEPRGERWTKIPVDPKTGRPASSTDASTWGSFIVACEAQDRLSADGVGFVLGDGFVGVDLDKVRDPTTGATAPWAMDIVVRLNTYAEMSVSGSGLHVIARGSLPPGRRRKGKIEMYSEARYFCMTGHRLPESLGSVEERTEVLAELHRELLGNEDKPPAPPAPSGPKEDPANAARITAFRKTLGDSKILELASSARNGSGEKFQRLMNGNTAGYQSESEADSALCCLLGFYCGGDAARVERLVGASALGQREKWRTRPDYRERTINNAILTLGGRYYTGSQPEPAVIEGPNGLKAEVVSASATRCKQTALLDLRVGEITIRGLSVSTSPSALDAAAREVRAAMPENGRAEIHAIKRFLRDAIRAGQQDEPSATGTKTMRQIVLEEAELRFRPRFRRENGTIWSERERRFLYRSQFSEDLVDDDLIDALQNAADSPRNKDGSRIRHYVLQGVAERVAKQIWARLSRDLPEQTGATLERGSAAAQEFAASIGACWTTSRSLSSFGDGVSKATTLVAEARKLAELVVRVRRDREAEESKARNPWLPVHENFSAWLKAPEAGPIGLAMRFELFHQMKVPLPPGCRCQQDFRVLAEGYGLGLEVRVGKQGSRAIALSADRCEELSASFADEDRGGDET